MSIKYGNRAVTRINKPETYQKIEYLESSGTQYINTGLHLSGENVEIEGNFYLINYSSSYAAWFRQYSAEGKESFRIIRANTNNNSLYYVCGANASNSSAFAIQGLDNLYNFKLLFNSLTINGQTLSYSPSIGVGDSSKLYVFYSGTSGRFYSFKVKDGQIQILNLIPCRRISDSTLGMYDTVSGTFMKNSGTGVFIAGPDIVGETFVGNRKVIKVFAEDEMVYNS